MTTRELLIQEINQAPEDVLQKLLRYLQTEQQRCSASQLDKSAKGTLCLCRLLELIYWYSSRSSMGTTSTRDAGTTA